MPEAPVDEDGYPALRKRNVDSRSETLQRRSPINPIAHPSPMELPSKRDFGCCVALLLCLEAPFDLVVLWSWVRDGCDSARSPRLAQGSSRFRCMQNRVVGLFAGVGGIELGLAASGFKTELMCEIDPGASAILRAHFPDVELASDVEELASLPACDVLTAGFPCQDLSQAGRMAGIAGSRSGLVSKIFDLLDKRTANPTWLLLENVPFMLRLDKGKAMNVLTDLLEARGYRWAYRVVDARSFGLPQRRRRVVGPTPRRPRILDPSCSARTPTGPSPSSMPKPAASTGLKATRGWVSSSMRSPP